MSGHDDATLHVTGAARYVDDLRHLRDVAIGLPVVSQHAHARIKAIDVDAARHMPNVLAVLTADDVAPDLRIGAVVHDEPVFARDVISFRGQTIALVVATTIDAARAAANLVRVEVEPLAPILGIAAAIDRDAFHGPAHVIERGDWAAALASAPLRVHGRVTTPAQDHFYLETHASLAVPGGPGDTTMTLYASSQHPTGIQAAVARVLGVGRHRVRCEVSRMGGGFGGKESQAETFAVLAALGATAVGRPVSVRLDRGQDMEQTGKRHPFRGDYELGVDTDGRVLALRVQLYSDGGWSTDLSLPVLHRAMLHLDNAYFVPALHVTGRVCRTNTASNTAFRGFGGPQGVLVIEHALDRAAQQLGLDPALVRRHNLYGPAPRNVAPYGQLVDTPLDSLWDRLVATSNYATRRAEIDRFNTAQALRRRGIGMTPVKFGISFTKALLNQAGALVLVYADGTVQVNHGGTEMGQGLHTKIRRVCARELGVADDNIVVMPTSTDKVPNTSATAASSGSDLNGAAVMAACRTLRQRLAPVAAALIGGQVDADRLVFAAGRITCPDDPGRGCTFTAAVERAWLSRVSLAATGHYATPGIAYDEARGQGTPFYYYACGAAVTEVEVDTFTGMTTVRRVDILHDVGRSLAPAVDRGQIEGGFVQGLGWLSSEDLRIDESGRVQTCGPSTYKIPSAGDIPCAFTVETFDDDSSPAIFRSKAVGEPPFLLAASFVSALHHAIASTGPTGRAVKLGLPCTPEAVLWALDAQRDDRKDNDESPPRNE